MDKRRIQKTLRELKASHAQLDALAVETANIEARIEQARHQSAADISGGTCDERETTHVLSIRVPLD